MWWGSLATWRRHRWCCGPMCHSHSGLGSGRHVRLENLAAERQKTDKQIGYWCGQINEMMLMSEEGKKKEGGCKKAFCLRIYTYSWSLSLFKVERTYVLLNELFWEKANIPKEQRRWSLPLVLCARAKPSSIRKKNIHTRGNTEDISLCNNPDVQYWSYGNQQNRLDVRCEKWD